MVRIHTWVALLAMAPCLVNAQIFDASLDTGRKTEPLTISLKPSLRMSPLPNWLRVPPLVNREAALIEFPIPPAWQGNTGDHLVLSVVFNDTGDGGPAVEWRASDGTGIVLSTGLGEVGNGVGLNARTVLLPPHLVREGGILQISYYGRYEALVNISLRPAREEVIAVLGAQATPGLLDESSRVYDAAEIDGGRPVPLTGDVRRGAVVEAELLATTEELLGAVEFVAPIAGDVEGAALQLDCLGLDLEATIGIHINGVSIGAVAFPTCRLDDPALVKDGAGRVVFAGWRAGSLFIPARFFVQGDNAILLTLKRSELESGQPVFLRNTTLHLRFGPATFRPSPVIIAPPEEPDLSQPVGEFFIH